jgi:DNA polymerase-3 subunit epsilon
VTYWALDLETGGLDARRDPIIAVGMVPVRSGVIRVGEAWESRVRPEAGREIRPESVLAHQLLAGELHAAPELPSVLGEIDRRLREGALLVHHQAVDVPFLKAAYARHGLRWPKPVVVDTVALLVKQDRRARFARGEEGGDGPEIRLGEARRAFKLPDYQAHDALTDAIATAELFLALRKALRARTLRDLR